jgi:hypothetical protein
VTKSAAGTVTLGLQGIQMNIKLKFFIVCIFTTGNLYAVEYEESLCTDKETMLFNCTAENKKIISLCGLKNADQNDIEYRYGKKNKIEFSYTSKKSKMRIGTYHGGRITTTLLWFENQGYTYSLFSPDWGEDGVAILKNGKRVALHNCIEKSLQELNDNFGNILIEKMNPEDTRPIYEKLNLPIR